MSKHDSCLVYKECEMGFFIAVIHVDDFAFGYSTEVVLEVFLATLRAEFGVKVEMPLIHYLGMKLTYREDGSILVTQPALIMELSERFGLDKFADVAVPDLPMDPKFNATSQDAAPVVERRQFLAMIGTLIHVTKTRPNIHTL